MFLADMKEMATKCALYGRGSQYFVTVGLADDEVATEDAYLVMVNAHGDRVAVKYPGSDWLMDEKVIRAYNPDIPKFTNAIRFPGLQMENK